jgi:hypothetical protein
MLEIVSKNPNFERQDLCVDDLWLYLSVWFGKCISFSCSIYLLRCVEGAVNLILLMEWWQTPEECTHLIQLATPSMVKSTVVDNETGKSKDSRFVLFASSCSLKLSFVHVNTLFSCMIHGLNSHVTIFNSELFDLWIFWTCTWHLLRFWTVWSMDWPHTWHLQFWECRVRTSSGTFLNRGQDKVIERIEQRIADFTFIPVGKSKA